MPPSFGVDSSSPFLDPSADDFDERGAAWVEARKAEALSRGDRVWVLRCDENGMEAEFGNGPINREKLARMVGRVRDELIGRFLADQLVDEGSDGEAEFDFDEEVVEDVDPVVQTVGLHLFDVDVHERIFGEESFEVMEEVDDDEEALHPGTRVRESGTSVSGWYYIDPERLPYALDFFTIARLCVPSLTQDGSLTCTWFDEKGYQYAEGVDPPLSSGNGSFTVMGAYLPDCKSATLYFFFD